MSSRNTYLTPAQRLLAPRLFHPLCAVRDEILSGNKNFSEIVARQQQSLLDSNFNIDYFTVCRSTDLSQASPEDQNLVILIAAKFGATRLIDNIYLQTST